MEDALLYVVLDADAAANGDPAAWAEGAIRGGADVLQAPGAAGPETLQALRDVCRREDALLIVTDAGAGTALEGADGVHLRAPDGAIGVLRAAIGPDRLLGVTTRSIEDIQLALEVGADYVLHYAGVRCPGDFSAVGRGAGGFLYAAGIDSEDAARAVAESGVFRVCIESRVLDAADPAQGVAAYARVLGREI
ncbi:MAG: thiamine phosphate synthase [Lentisphaerae bacterium]|nr:thiamine phosphate synthase [Lentisphaerota bacterium]